MNGAMNKRSHVSQRINEGHSICGLIVQFGLDRRVVTAEIVGSNPTGTAIGTYPQYVANR